MSEIRNQTEQAKSRFPDGFRILQGRQEYITYMEHSSIRVWTSDVAAHYDLHSHSAIEVILPDRGEAAYQVQEEAYHVRPGEVLILPSGCHAKAADAFSGDPEFDSEWAWMRSLLLSLGVPDDAILREDKATFTWENATFSRKVTDGLHLPVHQAILCCRSYHARRALFYYQAAYPESRILTVPAAVPAIGPDTWYLTEEGRHTVLGEVRRMGSQVMEIFDCLMEGREPPPANTLPFEGN